MIYKINNKYYVKIGYEYNEIDIVLDDKGDVALVPLKNRIEGNGLDVKQINFLEQKENLKKELLSKNKQKSTTDDDEFHQKRSRSMW